MNIKYCVLFQIFLIMPLIFGCRSYPITVSKTDEYKYHNAVKIIGICNDHVKEIMMLNHEYSKIVAVMLKDANTEPTAKASILKREQTYPSKKMLLDVEKACKTFENIKNALNEQRKVFDEELLHDRFINNGKSNRIESK